MKSLELICSNFVAVAEKNGKGKEAKAIMKESPGAFLERKAHELEQLCAGFVESIRESAGVAKNELVESFKRNLGFTQEEAEVAAGIRHTNRNTEPVVRMLTEVKAK